MVEEYDPNRNWDADVVKVVLMVWGYKKEVSVIVGGNMLGFNVFNAALESVVESLYAEQYEEKSMVSIVLTNSEGKQIEVEDEEEKGVDWLKEMVVSVSISEKVDKNL